MKLKIFLPLISVCLFPHAFGSPSIADPISRTGPAILPWEEPSPEDRPVDADLRLIFKSVETDLPLTRIAQAQVEVAEGKEVAAQGAFDYRLQLQASTLAESYDQKVIDGTISKPIRGTPLEVFGGWRRGQGVFRSYEGKSLTGSDGEYRGGLKLPLLRDFLADSGRTRAVVATRLLESEKENSRFRILELKRIASDRYWEWVGAHSKLKIVFGLYRLAEERQSQIRRRVKAGSSAFIESVEVERMIVQRKAQLIEAERAYQKSSLELSLYYRDASGKMQNSISLPKSFDLDSTLPGAGVDLNIDEAVQKAVVARADINALNRQLEAVDAENELLKTQMLPKLDAQIEYAYDRGLPKDGEKELRGSLTFSFPLENREARGNLTSARARMEQMRLTRGFLRDQVKQELLSLNSLFRANRQKAEAMLLDRDLTEKLAHSERKRFHDGLSSLLFVNLREQTANDSAVKAVEAIVEFHKVNVLYQVSQGVDPAI